jgi:transmembrane sensor
LEQATITNLFQKYLNNECSPAEVDQLMDFLEQNGNEELKQQLINTQLAAGLTTWGYSDPLLQQQLENQLQVILQRINHQPQPAKLRSFSWIKLAAAAIVILFIGGAAFLWMNRSEKVETAKQSSQPVKDVPPGGNKAVLTLANGSTIVLDDAANGDLAREGNVQVTKLSNGQLVYKVITKENAPVTYNTLSTPRGGQYQLVLPDGSKVWLNAASSIRFPTAFTGTERKVEITGEAYFEVAKLTLRSGQKMPFRVSIAPAPSGASRGEVEVLGTHFNVNAYDDEDVIKTTLLEGKVKIVNRVSAIGKSVILKPGEQASISQASSQSNKIPVQTVDLEVVMAWKNGLFHFENADIKTVMRQLSRWYDVEVEYKTTALQMEPLFMEIPRNKNLSDVLKVISLAAGVQVKMEGKKIIVYN